ncbi:MAG TPA: hypothetical protein EYQ42_09805 [Thiotrichaceae bacterium]|jgi:hypothetical protein|nr:hypothetical protein [Thiotrichaceae bacterium]HIM09003.1 hypothetical protein [Gammaproteobacteria bacterium]
MSIQTLRDLAKNYAKGATSKDKYRQSRTELIRGIIEGKIAVKAIDYEAPLKAPNDMEEAITQGIKRDKTKITSPQQKQADKRKRVPPVEQKSETKKTQEKSSLVFILVSAVIVLSLIVTVFLFYPKPPESKTIKTPVNASSTSKNESLATATMNTNGTGESLIANFLSEKNWGDDSLNIFLESWSSLSQEQRDSAKQSKRMKRMHDSIYKQFLEEKAFANIDSEVALANQQKLIDFANTLELNDVRLTLD